MKKIMILLILVLGVVGKVFAFTDTLSRKSVETSSQNWLYLIVVIILIGIFIWALYDWGWLKTNGFFKKKRKFSQKNYIPPMPDGMHDTYDV